MGMSYIDRLVQERRNSIANALELRLSCTNPSIWKDCLYIEIDSVYKADISEAPTSPAYDKRGEISHTIGASSLSSWWLK